MKKPPEELSRRLYEASDRFLGPGGDVRMDKVAELTGIPRATVYYYFSGKDDLLAFLMGLHIDHGAELLEPALAIEGSPTVRMRGVLGAMVQVLADHPALCTHLLGLMATGGAPPELLMLAEEKIFAPVRSILVEGRESGDFVFEEAGDTLISLMGALIMVGMMEIISTGSLDADRVRTSLVEQLLRGIRTDLALSPA